MAWRVIQDFHSGLSGTWLAGWGDEFPPATVPPHKGAKFHRLDLAQDYIYDGTSWSAIGSGSFTVQEVDGAPAVINVTALQLDQADGLVLTDLGGGAVRVDLSAIPQSLVDGLVAALAGKAPTTTKLDDWAKPDDNTDLNSTTTEHGLLRKLDGNTSNFLRGDGAWATPAAAPAPDEEAQLLAWMGL